MDFENIARFGEKRVMETVYTEADSESQVEASLYAKVVDEETGEIIIDTEGSGEGEEKLFTTAVVNVINDVSGITFPVIYEIEGIGEFTTTGGATSGRHNVILYKNKYATPLPQGLTSLSVSGNAVVENNILIISGDASIDINVS